MSRRKIVIYTTSDYNWAFNTWKDSLPALLEEYDVKGVLLFPDQLGGRKGMQIPLYYLKTFGFINFILFASFAVLQQLRRIFSSVSSWKALAKKHNIPLLYYKNPNQKEVIEWTQDCDPDVIVIMVSQILKKEVLSIPKLGVINKHAAILPSCRGVYPYFWAKLYGLPLGYSFHEVTEGIDKGKILYQHRVSEDSEESLIAFYKEVYAEYKNALLAALRNLESGEFISPENVEDSYFSFPLRKDYKNFRNQGYRIARLKDLF